jgi:hypothetical protein
VGEIVEVTWATFASQAFAVLFPPFSAAPSSRMERRTQTAGGAYWCRCSSVSVQQSVEFPAAAMLSVHILSFRAAAGMQEAEARIGKAKR